MQKTIAFFVLLIFLINACDNIPDSVVDPMEEELSVSISVPVQLIYDGSDKELKVKASFSSSKNIKNTWFTVKYYDGSYNVASKVFMNDKGQDGDFLPDDNTYTGSINLTKDDPRGIYDVEIFLITDSDVLKKVSVSRVNFKNYEENIAPIISDLSAPDTIVVQSPKSIILLSLKASDQNGLPDIQSVYFTSTRPDGTSSGNKIYMNDAGKDGDYNAGDGIYSLIIEVTPSNQKGTYRFDFNAEDRSGAKSNLISHNIVLK